LGLKVPENWPEPGQYKEPYQDIQQLEGFLREAGNSTGRACNPETPARMDEQFSKGFIVAALSRLLTACNSNRTSSTANRTTAQASLNATEAALDAAMPPATLVDTEFLAVLMRGYYGLLLTFQDGDYKAVQGSDALRSLVATYPWKAGGCAYPNLPRFIAETRGAFNRSLVRPTELKDLTTPKKATYAEEQLPDISDGKAQFEYDVQHGWWPATVRGREILDWRAAVIENATRSQWPTLIEARLILDEYRNSTRTLTTDASLESLEWIPENWGIGWTSDPWPSMQVYPIQAMQWRFDAVECSMGRTDV
jgi:hypothetical protein